MNDYTNMDRIEEYKRWCELQDARKLIPTYEQWSKATWGGDNNKQDNEDKGTA